MAVTYGFYNSVDGDRKYDARQFGQLFDGIIRDGIFMSIGDRMMVKANYGMFITVGSGHAWFNRTWTNNDVKLGLLLNRSEVILNRIDTVVLEVNTHIGYRKNSIKVISGTPALNPEPPILFNTEDVHQYPLADIFVAAETVEITQADITNRVGTSDTPFVTGILETMDIDDLIVQWQEQWKKSINTIVDNTNSWVTAFEKELITWKIAFENGNILWESKQKESFVDWFETVKEILPEGVLVPIATFEIDQIMEL